MSKVLKKTVSLVLVAVMVICAAPLGVFAQSDDIQPDVENDVSMEATSAFGSMLTDAVDTQELDADSPYYISDLIFDGNNATASYYNESACTLVVAIYDETTNQMLDSAVIAVGAESLEATVSFSSVPENFIAKAFLLDENNFSLCKPYTCNENTAEYKEFMSKTTKDFDEERVINLDDSETNNFAVLSDDTIIVSGSEEINVLESTDIENDKYVFANIDEQIKNLKVGDAFYLDNGDLENITVIKIASISVDRDKAIIIADTSSLAELFEYVKISTESTTEEFEYMGDNADEGVTYLGDVDYETGEAIAPVTYAARGVDIGGPESYSKRFEFKDEDEIFSGSANLKIELNLKVFICSDYGEVSLTLTPSANLSISVSGTAPLKEFSFGKLKVATIACATVYIEPTFVVEVSGEITVSGELAFTLGVGWKSGIGIINKCEMPSFDPEPKAEATIFIGIDLKPELAVIHEYVASASMSGTVGVEIQAELTDDNGENHTCTDCIDGTINGKLEISAKVTVAKKCRLGGEWEATLLSISFKINDFYYSVDNSKFGWGECPYTSEDSENSSGIKAQGACEDNLIWVLYNDGELVISGTGAMKENPWNEFKDDIKSVVIYHGVTSISNFAFTMCQNLESVSIPSSVVSIGNTAFAACSSLNDITISEGVKSIDYDAFWNCSALEFVKLPESLTNIGTAVFSDCTSLKQISIPCGINQIPDYIFNGCANLEEITMHNGITYIGVSAFADCVKLKNVDIPSVVTYIGSSAFSKCEELKEVRLPEGIENINSNTFTGCKNLISVVIPENVTLIDDYAFENCVKLNDITIYDNVEYIGCKAFANTAYYNDSSKWENDGLYIGNHFITNSSEVSGIYEIKEGTKTIAGYASAGCSNLKGIIIPNSVVSIGNHAFTESGLQNVTISDSVRFIDSYAFSKCYSLESVIIGDGVETIGSYAFEYCESLSYLNLGENLKNIGISSFYGCKSLCSVSFPEGVKVISGRSFSSCDSLETVYLPSTIESIVGFSSCIKLKTIYYAGTSEQWAEINISEDNNKSITNATKHYNYNYLLLTENEQISTCSVDELSESRVAIQQFVVLIDNAIKGNNYVLFALKQTEGAIICTSENILYIDVRTAVSSQTKFSFVPKSENIGMIVVIGDFGNGIETVVIDSWYNEYDVTWNTDGKTVTQTVIEGAEITAPENPTKTGYTFTGWSPSIPDIMPAEDLTFTAVFEANSYNAVFDANGGKWADETEEKIIPTDFDSEIIAPNAPAKQGYVFSKWSPEIGIMDSVDGKNFVAEWVAATDTRYTVETYTMNALGEYEKTVQTLEGTTNATVNAEYVTETGCSLNTEKSIICGTVAADNSLVLKVYIDRNAYTFKTVIDGVSTETKYLFGSVIPEPAAPTKDGYKFMGWTPAVPDTMPAENITVTAMFEKSYICPDCGNEILGETEINEHIAAETKITLSDGVIVTSGELKANSTITVSAPKVDGKIFSHWVVDGATAESPESPDTTIVLGSGKITITAEYDDCNCKCHQGGIAGFFFRFILFFQKLFGNNLECSCGAKH